MNEGQVDQETVAIIQAAEDKCRNDRGLKDGSRYVATDAPQLTQCGKAARCCPLHVGLHDENADITDTIAFFSRNSVTLLANYVTVVEGRPIMSAKHLLPSSSLPLLAKTNQSFRAASAIAELLVT